MLDNSGEINGNTDKKRMPGGGYLIYSYFYKAIIFINHQLDLSKFTTLLLLPALFSCEHLQDGYNETHEAETETKITVSYDCGINSLDIFAFDNDDLMRLDSYQHWGWTSYEGIGLRSQNGEKVVFVCANGQRTKDDWSCINSWASLDDCHVELAKENRNAPCMTGKASITAGDKKPSSILLTRVVSEVRLRSLKCDFTDRNLRDKSLTDVKVYLTNVNARCSINAEGEVMPMEIINSGGLDNGDMEELSDTDIIFHKIEGKIGSIERQLNLSMLCYPNSCQKEGPGTPFTRLVIEGRLDGDIYWWPININRDEDIGQPGIHRNRQYVYDIVLKRKGSSSSDEVIEIEDASIKMNITPWEEKEEYEVAF